MTLVSFLIFPWSAHTGVVCKLNPISVHSAKREIRLLRVHTKRLRLHEVGTTFPQWLDAATDISQASQVPRPGDAEASFICYQLREQVQLDLARGNYAALSYCAGQPTNTAPIIVEDFWFNAFSNLEHALDGFRANFDRQSKSRNVVWSYQICINHVVHIEKFHQVAFMRDVYKSAEWVYVVLSNPSYCMATATSGANAMRDIWCNYENCEKKHETGLSLNDVNVVDAEGNRILSPREAEHTGSLHNHLIHAFFKSKTHVFPHFKFKIDSLFGFIRETLTSSWWSRAWVCRPCHIRCAIYSVAG